MRQVSEHAEAVLRALHRGSATHRHDGVQVVLAPIRRVPRTLSRLRDRERKAKVQHAARIRAAREARAPRASHQVRVLSAPRREERTLQQVQQAGAPVVQAAARIALRRCRVIIERVPRRVAIEWQWFRVFWRVPFRYHDADRQVRWFGPIGLRSAPRPKTDSTWDARARRRVRHERNQSRIARYFGRER